jgi:hypothetical protein
LSGTEMKMCLVLWDRLIRVQWFIRINQQMVVTGIWRFNGAASAQDSSRALQGTNSRATSNSCTLHRAVSFDHLVGGGEQDGWYGEA